MKKITKKLIDEFKLYLIDEEKSGATIEKYVRDITAFAEWTCGQEVSKALVLEYKQKIVEGYLPASVNSMISSLNCFFDFAEWHECRVKSVKIQRQIFAREDKELTKAEYERLVKAAKEKGNERLFYLIQTICATGIRVSELKHITVEALNNRQAQINCKGKMRIIILTKQLCKMLKEYTKKNNIKSGPVFVSKNGRPLDRSNIWSDMKKLCESAGVSQNKVFPHNLRHLFARTFYSIEKDIVRLADILGHSSVETTRIYTIETSDVHRMQMQKLKLLL